MTATEWNELTGVQLEHLGSTMIARAAERRRTITTERAWQAFWAVELSEHWQKSVVSENGRIRGALQHLIGVERLHPEQVAGPMLAVAYQVSVHPSVAEEAVAAGIADGMQWREGPSDE